MTDFIDVAATNIRLTTQPSRRRASRWPTFLLGLVLGATLASVGTMLFLVR